MINDTLKKIGLNEKEIEVYLTVLKHGKITPADVAKNTSINRSTVYSVAKELIKKGVISEDLGSSTQYLTTTDPKDLLHLINAEEKTLERKKDLANKAIKELSQLALGKNYSIPRIRFVDESKIDHFLHEQTSKWNESIKKYDGMWWGFQDESFVKSYGNWMADYWKDPSSKGVGGRGLTNETNSEQILRSKASDSRSMKYWDSSNEFSGSLWVAGDYILMIVTKQHPHYLLEINDPVLACNQREIIKQLWKRTP